MLKPIEADVLMKMKKYCTPFVVEMLQQLRMSILVRIGEG
jgi:hypothetical protein